VRFSKLEVTIEQFLEIVEAQKMKYNISIEYMHTEEEEERKKVTDMDIDMDHGDHHTMAMHHDHTEMSTIMMMSDIADEDSPSFCHGMGMIM
jgi:hypothetical protein